MVTNERAQVELSVVLRYPYEEPTLGELGADIVAVDRALRDAIRRSRTVDAPQSERAGWPPLRDSPHVMRATVNSPLEIEAVGVFLNIAENLAAAGLIQLFREALARRARRRRRGDGAIVILTSTTGAEQASETIDISELPWDWPPAS